ALSLCVSVCVCVCMPVCVVYIYLCGRVHMSLCVCVVMSQTPRILLRSDLCLAWSPSQCGGSRAGLCSSHLWLSGKLSSTTVTGGLRLRPPSLGLPAYPC